VKRTLRVGQDAFGLLELLGLDLSIDFPLPQISDERSRLSSETFGLALK
jgi:hypothetical protein